MPRGVEKYAFSAFQGLAQPSRKTLKKHLKNICYFSENLKIFLLVFFAKIESGWYVFYALFPYMFL